LSVLRVIRPFRGLSLGKSVKEGKKNRKASLHCGVFKVGLV